MNAYEFSLTISKALKEKWKYLGPPTPTGLWWEFNYETEIPYQRIGPVLTIIGGVYDGCCPDFCSLDAIMPALRWIEEKHDSALGVWEEACVSKKFTWSMFICKDQRLVEPEIHSKTDAEAAARLLCELCELKWEDYL